jgi:cytochrome c oxidase subunit I
VTTLDRPAPATVEPTADDVAEATYGVFRRPLTTTGWKSWLFTVDHKRIGIMYGVAAISFFVVGGIEALLIRLQLAGPDGTVLSADVYNQMFTMHATSMVFLFAMPMAAAFANYLIPLQVGARDVAFPRLNAFSFWCFLVGALFVNSSWLLGGAADGGWFMYAPNSGVAFSPSHGIDIWAMGLQITGIASLVGAINLIVTVINMRAPGMTFMRMPTFTWMALVTQFLLLFAIPVITVALVLLTLQRSFGATFFEPAAGADPLLWQHLFWIFGHPEVYILILPAFGITSEIVPVFSKKPLFGYPLVVFSGAVIGFVGFGVWAHHMFASGLGPISVSVFAIGSMVIAIPTGVKIVNWTLTMWGGKLRFTVAMMFAVGLIVQFTVGGLSGVTHAVAPSDTQQTDTYYIVAHIHYVLFGGAVLGFFGAFYYWWPKAFGRCLSERLGYWNFWLMIVGMNLTFGPMHVIGLQGQPRRMYVWTEARAGSGFFNLGFWNLVATVGAFVMAIGILLFIVNVVHTYRTAPPAPLDPWDARTIEWMTANPPAPHNWDRIPRVEHLDEFFHRKYQDVGGEGRADLRRIATAEDVFAENDGVDTSKIHLPAPSYWPLVLSLSLPVIAAGVIYHYAVAGVGVAMLLLAAFGWALEPESPPGDHPPSAG